jgi:eukaryotic-like serine/threonine-protein kinase
MMAVERIPQFWKLYHSSGEVKVEEGGTGMWRVEALGVTDSYLHTMAMSGFYQRLLELAGAREVRASVVQSRARGDERTITALRWR